MRARGFGELVTAFLEKAGYQLTDGADEGNVTIVVDDEGWYSENNADSELMKLRGGVFLPMR